MNVTIMTYTNDPMRAISLAAGICYGKRNYSEKRVLTCYKRNHMSVFEQASVQFLIEGISRACSHQLVRHRLNSYCQESQRYCKYDFNEPDWYVTPDAYAKDPDWEKWHARSMHDIAQRYRLALKIGMKAEDARYILPEACKTNIMVTMNIRNLYHFFDMRLADDAQHEIREMAQAMLDECKANDDLRPLISLYETGELNG